MEYKNVYPIEHHGHSTGYSTPIPIIACRCCNQTDIGTHSKIDEMRREYSIRVFCKNPKCPDKHIDYSILDWYLQNIPVVKIRDLGGVNWEDKYRLQLCIFDHLQEVPLLVNEWRKTKNKETEEAYKKEMMDLYILLDIWQEDNQALYERRLKKFQEEEKENAPKVE